MELHTNREEILAKHCKYGVEFIKDSEPINMDQSEVFPAMDEYSRLVGMAVLNYAADNGYIRTGEDVWYKKTPLIQNQPKISSSQLFDLFIKEYGK